MELKLLESAVLLAFDYHKGQTRKFTNEPYVNHCLRVGSLLGDYTDDSELVAAGLTHDLLEDTYAEILEIETVLGKRVAKLVWEVTDNKRLKYSMSYNEYTLDKFNSLSDDAFIIKLIDRLDNLTGLINNQYATISFIKKYVAATDYALDNLNRNIIPMHTVLINNLNFVNNYLVITYLR